MSKLKDKRCEEMDCPNCPLNLFACIGGCEITLEECLKLLIDYDKINYCYLTDELITKIKNELEKEVKE